MQAKAEKRISEAETQIVVVRLTLKRFYERIRSWKLEK